MQGDEAGKLRIFFYVCVFNVCYYESNAAKKEAKRDFFLITTVFGVKEERMIGFTPRVFYDRVHTTRSRNVLAYLTVVTCV